MDISETIPANRIIWIDCAKLVAIIAVVVDHCNGFAYHNQVFAQISYFSVSLFVLLSGLSTGMNQKRRTFSHQLKRIGKLFKSYALATFIILIWHFRFFDLKTYLTHLINFSIQGQYYYLVFFFQLLFVTPYLLDWFLFCRKKKYAALLHILTLWVLCGIASLTIRYTYVLPVHGGGQFLLGGTYLILYYLGIILSDVIKKVDGIRQLAILFILSVLSWGGWLILRISGKLVFDNILEPYFGAGLNPPGFVLMVYSGLTMFVLFSFFSMLERVPYKIVQRILKLGAFLGQYTMYTFLYHCLVRDIILRCVPSITQNIWWIRIFVFVPMIVFPVFGGFLIKMIFSLWHKRVCLGIEARKSE